MIKNFISTLLARFQSEDEEGQTLVEYGLLLALIAIIVIVALLFLGPIVCEHLQNVGRPAHLSSTSSTAEAPSGIAAGRFLFARRSRAPGVPPAQVLAHKSSRCDLPRVRRLLTAVTTLRYLESLIPYSSTRAQRGTFS